jgi:hypothetical protein
MSRNKSKWIGNNYLSTMQEEEGSVLAHRALEIHCYPWVTPDLLNGTSVHPLTFIQNLAQKKELNKK